jgi:small membrane protein
VYRTTVRYPAKVDRFTLNAIFARRHTMIAQLFLSVLLLGILLYAWMEYRRAPIIAIAAVLAVGGGLYFVWFPSHATGLAEFVGIGRGVDLIIYVWVVISLLIVLNLHLKLRSQMELITELAREIAILKGHSGQRI